MAVKKPPFNVQIVNPPEYIERWGLLPVTHHAIYEASSEKFHPDGFFSEVIFGQMGSNERLIKKGYIDLRTSIITPHLYKQLLTLKGYYKDILAGREYAYFDRETKNFIKTTADDPNGDTGYSFFLSHIYDIEFPETGSDSRHMKIELFKKYRDRILMNQFIVLPAGMRDVRNEDGKAKSEDINKLYFGLLSLTKAMPVNPDDGNIKLFDGIRYQIQNKVQEIYQYVADLFDGKGGFAQSKYASRSIVYSGRNVITAAPLTRVERPDSEEMLSADEVLVPLFQAMKECQPLMIHMLTKVFFDQIFQGQNLSVPLIDPKTLKLEMHSIHPDTLKKFTTADGINDLINNFNEPNIQMQPVTIPVEDSKTPCYLYMVYDTGDEVYEFRNIEEFLQDYRREHKYSMDNVPNLEWLEGLPPDQYVILFSGALAAMGMSTVPKDFDLLVSNELFDKYLSNDQYKPKVPMTGDKPQSKPTLLEREDGKIELGRFHGAFNGTFNHIKTWNEFITKYCIKVGQYNILKPDYLLSYYQSMDRPKDQDKIQFLKTIVPDTKYVRPMTWAEMFYIAAYAATKDKYCTCTRYPVLNLEGIMPFKLHLTTTEPNRRVTFKLVQEGIPTIQYPHYPKIGEAIKASLSVHPSSLANYDGDHDGDVLSLIVMMSDEANQEIKDFLESPISMVNSSGKLVTGLGNADICKYQFYSTTYHQLQA